MKVYKIRNKETGMFSGGGSYPRWVARGKVWTDLRFVKSHLRMFDENSMNLFYNLLYFKLAEVVEYECSEIKIISLEEIS